MPIVLKKLTLVVVVSIFMLLQMPTSVLAATATDSDALAAADKAVDYLAGKQESDGSVPGFGGETEWTVVALKANGDDPKDFKKPGGDSAVEFIKNSPSSALATDLENKIIALSAAGEDTSELHDDMQAFHSEGQIGNKQFLNDDMFGIIAIKAANDQNLKPMAQDGLNYLIANQNADKGFGFATADFADNCCSASEIDMTSAAIVAMHAAEQLELTNPDLTDSKEGAVIYLLSKQNTDGSFNAFGSPSADSTSWALIAFNVIGESVRAQALLARNWLILNQNNDGSFGTGTFTTPHATIALLGSSWLLDPSPISGSLTPTPTLPEENEQQNQADKTYKLASVSDEQGIVLASSTDSDQSGDNQQDQAGNIGAASSTSSNNQADKKTNYSAYALVVLGLIAVGWFVIQSRQKQGV